jgi:hypothetical protein
MKGLTMKCFQCGQRKGKRFCPAENRGICAQCCGEKRVIEIPCPPDCQFLKSGQTYHWVKKHMAILQTQEDPSRMQQLYKTSQQFHFLLDGMEEVIVGYASELTSITDGDVHKAIVALKSTLETEQKGVIYEHSTSNPLAQALAKELQSFLEKERSESSERGNSLRTSDLVACLDFLEEDVSYHLANDSASNSYLQFIARSHPEAATKQNHGGIILAP